MSPVQNLLAAVRRRLWRRRLLAAGRLACWVSSGLMLAAMAWHLAVGPIPVDAAAFAVVACWAVTTVWAAWRRPTDWECALWADRYLDGASAFTTWLDLGEGRLRPADAQAVAWLEQWVGSRVLPAMQSLAQRREAVRWSPPMLSMLACTALAALVLTMPELGSPTRARPGAPAPAAAGGPTLTDTEGARKAELAAEVAKALRSVRTQEASAGPSEGRASGAAAGRIGDGQPPAPLQPGASASGEPAAAGSAPSATVAQAATARGASQAAAGASGRDAGDSRDDGAAVADSRLLHGTIPVQRYEIRPRRPTAEWQADMERPVAYDEDPAVAGDATPSAAAPAATPPSATASTRLSPTEASYVQAWTKASAPRR